MFENADDVLPLYVDNENIVISGKMAVKNRLISLEYDTVPDAECVVVSGY